MSISDDRPRLSDAEAEALLNAIAGVIPRGDEAQAQHVAELERIIVGLHEVLPVLATEAMKLADIEPLRDPADAKLVEEVLGQARKVMEYLEPQSR